MGSPVQNCPMYTNTKNHAQIYVFNNAELIGTGYRTDRCTSTPTTMPTSWSTATSRCSAPWHHIRLILVSRCRFLTMLSLLEQVTEMPDVHQQQYKQQGPGHFMLLLGLWASIPKKTTLLALRRGSSFCCDSNHPISP